MTSTDDTLIAAGARNVLRMERRYPHPPEKVWRAVTEPEQLSAWFPFAVELTLEPGGAMRFGMGDHTIGETGVVTAVEAPRLFAFEWGDDAIRIELEPTGDGGTLLVFTHTFGDRYGAASFAAGWDACLGGLAAVLDGDEPQPPDDMNAQHERYVEQLDLAGAVVERGAEGWSIRIERQLTQPAERVWEVLVEGAGPGTLLTADPPRLLEYEWTARDGRLAGRVRWELREGTGHGARLVLTQTGAPQFDAELAPARAACEQRVARLAAKLAGEPRAAR